MGTTLCTKRHQMVSLEGSWIRHTTTRNRKTCELLTNTVVYLGRSLLSIPRPSVMASNGQRHIYTGKASSQPKSNNRFLSYYFILTLYLQPKDIQWCPLESWISWWAWYTHNPNSKNQTSSPSSSYVDHGQHIALPKGCHGTSYGHDSVCYMPHTPISVYSLQ